MINLAAVIYILFIHFVADFLCQTDYWARNKSKSNSILATHVGIYSMLMTGGVWVIGIGLWPGFVFFAVTFICHFITDYFSSRKTSKLFAAENYHWGFVVVGADQFAHYVQLLITYWLLTT